MQHLTTYTTSISSLDTQSRRTLSNVVHQEVLSNLTSLTKYKINPSTQGYFYKAYLISTGSMPVKLSNELSYYFQDQHLVTKILNLVENIGVNLFSQLSDEEKLLMARTAGSIEFQSKIDINSVYGYLESSY